MVRPETIRLSGIGWQAARLNSYRERATSTSGLGQYFEHVAPEAGLIYSFGLLVPSRLLARPREIAHAQFYGEADPTEHQILSGATSRIDLTSIGQRVGRPAPRPDAEDNQRIPCMAMVPVETLGLGKVGADWRFHETNPSGRHASFAGMFW